MPLFSIGRLRISLKSKHEAMLNLQDRTPYQNPQYCIPYRLRPHVRREILNLLDQGVIQPSDSPYRNNIIAIPKPHNPSQIRIVIDLRSNNSRCTPISDPTQPISNIIDKMAG